MKNGKLHKSRIINVLLGLAAAGVLLLTACQNIFDMAEPKTQDDEYGYVVVDLGDSARTLRPNIDSFTKYLLTFRGVDVKVGSGKAGDPAWTNGTEYEFVVMQDIPNPFRLPIETGTGKAMYTLEVKAYTGGPTYNLAAEGEYKGNGGKFTIIKGETTYLDVVLDPVMDATGTFNVTLTLPNTAWNSDTGTPLYTYKLQRYLGKELQEPITDPAVFDLPRTSGANSFTLDFSGPLSAGTYLFTVRINTSDAQYGGFSEAVHIYNNMVTTFTKDYTVTDGEFLASVTNPAEAINILKREIADWVYDGVLSSVNGGINTTAVDGVIMMYYVTSRPALDGNGKPIIGSSVGTFPATSPYTGYPAFPIILQGGWRVKSGDWNVDNTKVKKLTLENPKVQDNYDKYIGGKTNGVSNVTVTTEYTVWLRAVAEYTLEWGGKDGANAGRSVTLKENADDAINPSGTIQFSEQQDGRIMGFGAVGSTDINITNAAIRVDEEPRAPQTGDQFSGVYNFTAESRPYLVQYYERTPEQVKAAFDTLKDNLVQGDKWVDQMSALARYNPDEWEWDEDLIDPADPDFVNEGDYGAYNTVNLYYVVSRLGAGSLATSFHITLPFDSTAYPLGNSKRDTRWVEGTDWVLRNGLVDPTTTAGAATANSGDKKIIYYYPYGGKRQTFIVNLYPVSEFYVNWADNELNGSIPETGKVVIKDNRAAGAAAPPEEFTRDNGTVGPFGTVGQFNGTNGSTYKRGKRFVLGSLNVALTDTAITLDIDNGDPANAGNGDAINDPTNNSFVQFIGNLPASLPAGRPNNTDVVRTDRNVTVTSREYHIKVFRTIEKQMSDAKAEIREETEHRLWTNYTWSGAGAAPYAGLIPFGITQNADVNTSNLIYVMGTAAPGEPELKIRDERVYNNSVWQRGTTFGVDEAHGRGWELPDGYAAKVSATPMTTTPYNLRFTPNGGYRDSSGIYKIRVIPAARYIVTYQKKPIGNDGTTGDITVQGSLPDSATLDEPRPYSGSTAAPPNSNPVNGATSQDAELIVGIGAPIRVVATTAGNLNIVSSDNQPTVFSTSVNIGADGVATGIPQSKTYFIKVYPSIPDQKANVLAGLKGVEGVGPWLGSPTVNKFRYPTAADVLNTAYQVVLDPTGAASTTIPPLTVPTGFLNSDYIVDTPSPARGINISDGPQDSYGKRASTLTFVPLGRANNNDDLVYTFNITAIAQYNIEFKYGPTGIKTVGKLDINTYKPGTNGAAAADKLSISKNGNDPTNTTEYGGIGSFSSTPNVEDTTISANSTGQPNIFATDAAATGVNTGAGGGNSFVASDVPVTISNVTSRVYTIRVYPTVNDQVAQIKAQLDRYAGSNALTKAEAWFKPDVTTGAPASQAINRGALFTRDSPYFSAGTYGTNEKDVLQVQYLNSTVTGGPTVAVEVVATLPYDVTPGQAYTGSDYRGSNYPGYVLSSTNPSIPAANSAGNGVDEVSIRFRPIAPTDLTQEVYKIRRIPLVKYTVNYTGAATGEGTPSGAAGAMGTVTIKPTGSNVVTPGPLMFNAITPPAPQYGYAGRGATDIEISATEGSYDEVQIRQVGLVNPVILTGLASNATGGKLILSFTGNHPYSTEYEILLIKKP